MYSSVKCVNTLILKETYLTMLYSYIRTVASFSGIFERFLNLQFRATALDKLQIFIAMFALSSFPTSILCVTSHWSSCPTPEPVDLSSMSRVMTSSSLRLFSTKRQSFSRNSCLDISWLAWALIMINGGSYYSCKYNYHKSRRLNLGSFNE